MLGFGFKIMAVYVVREVLGRFLAEHFCSPVPLIFHQYAYLFPVLREEDNVTVGLDVCDSQFTKHSLRLIQRNILVHPSLVPTVRCLIV